MLILPLRAKNPPEHFPFVTVALIVINTTVFLLTSDNFMSISERSVQDYAVSHATLSLFRLFTAMFLHANWQHLAGNMLFLWVFGASVEGRLRPLKFISLYIIAGFAGGLLHDAVWGAMNPARWGLGASGAIMGVAGAYLYMFAYSSICVFTFIWIYFYIRIGVSEWYARWVVLLFVGIDVFSAFFPGGDGVAHLAHLGGFGAGFLMVALLRVRRDSEEISEVQATRAEVKDYTLLSLSDLETLVQQPTDDMQLVLAYLERAVTARNMERGAYCISLINHYASPLILQADPERLAHSLLTISPSDGGMPLTFYLRLASRLEALHSNDLAGQCYRRVYDLAPTAPDTEMALFRLGQLMERAYHNRSHAQAIYAEMLRLFPDGPMAVQARHALQQM